MTVDRFQAICYPLTNQGRLTQIFTPSSAYVLVPTTTVHVRILLLLLVLALLGPKCRNNLLVCYTAECSPAVALRSLIATESIMPPFVLKVLGHYFFMRSESALVSLRVREWVNAAFPEVFAGRKSRGMVLVAWIFSLLLCIPQAHIFRSRRARERCVQSNWLVQIVSAKWMDGRSLSIEHNPPKVKGWQITAIVIGGSIEPLQ